MTTSDPQLILEQIKTRAIEATPGPWEAHENTVAAITGTGDCGGCSGILSPAHEPSCYWSQIAEAERSDAEFIAHAREDIPRLTEALEAVLSVHHAEWHEFHERYFCEGCFKASGAARIGHWPCPTVAAIETELIGDNDD